MWTTWHPLRSAAARPARQVRIAAAFIAQRFLDLQLVPAFTSCDSDGKCLKQPFQHFRHFSGIRSANIGALVEGSDPKVRHEVLVVGAHYDHIGRASTLARDRSAVGVRRGADDNASGTAALLELARRFAQQPARRSVLFAAFGAEEIGLVGSTVFVDNAPLSLDSVTVMLNLDMVGRLRGRLLTVYGLATSPPLEALLDSANASIGLRLRKLHGAGRSDHESFRRKGVPAVHFFTGEHLDYHTVRDRAESLNIPGLVQVIDLSEAVARIIADRSERLPRSH